MERQLAGSGSLAGGKAQLEGIIIQNNDANASVPVTMSEKIIQNNDANASVTVTMSEKNWLQDVMKKESSENPPEAIKQGGSWSKIEKVPEMLRDDPAYKSCYDPVVVAIGPYHHGKPPLKIMEQHKKTMARHYVKGNLDLLEKLYQKVSALAKDAKECYTYKEELAQFNDEKFIQMMVLDACFILQFIDCIVNHKLEELKMKNNMIALVQRDLFLLENQIPFKVLTEVLGVRSEDENKMEIFCEFFTNIRSFPPPAEKGSKTTIKNFFSDCGFLRKKSAKDDEHAHLLDAMRSNLVDKSAWTNKKETKPRSHYWFSYRSAMELKAVGIHFRRSKTNKFTDVDFQSVCYSRGHLKLPKICFDYSTKSMLLNMVAHESCTNGPKDFGVSSYICFMDSLVDHADDVKELRKNGILSNFLGSDQQVADLFNEITGNLVGYPSAYAVVKDRIERHYNSRMKTWWGGFFHTHFRSPWTVLAFFGAIFALLLSFIQTYKSINPSKCV